MNSEVKCTVKQVFDEIISEIGEEGEKNIWKKCEKKRI